MGAKSTRNIEKEYALDMISILLEKASDRAIADVLEVLNDDAADRNDFDNYLGLSNFYVV